MSDTVTSAQSFPGLVLLGISLLASLNLFYRDRSEGEDPLHLTMTVIGRVMILTGFVEACLVFLNIMAIPFFFVFTGVLVYVIFRYLLRRRSALLAVMAAAARRWMPLAPAVEAFSYECRGPLGRRCRHLAVLLNAGLPLPEALRANALAPPRAVALIEAGGRSGNLSGALAEAVRQPPAQMVLTKVWSAVWYICAMMLVGAVCFTWVMLKLVPAFRKIFSDFATELPALTVMLIDTGDYFAQYGWLPLLLIALAVGSFVVLWSFDAIAWLPPPLSTLSRRKETAVVLRSLAVAAETDRPLEPALAALAEYYPSMAMRVRLATALGQISTGCPWPESLADQGLLRRGELALVASAQRVGNLPWALREVADGIERRLALRLHRWLEIVVPIFILAVGAIVMVIVVGLFVPLVRLIERMV
jgi:type II secretory pathway component PulF